MKPEAQRIAIAKACKWPHEKTGCFAGYWKKWDGGGRTEYLDPLNDLNACHEMESWLLSNKKSDMWMRYDLLVDECCGSFSWHAEPEARCEAFLRTIGKWTDQ